MPQLKSQRDEPDTQREYETIYILRPDADTDQIHTVNTRVRKVIEDQGGKVIRVDNWGKRKLAYEIRKELKGIYLYWLYLGESELVTEIERNLRMLDLVIRHYTVKVEEGVDPEARPSLMDEESFAATATTVPDEEDAYLQRTAAAADEARSAEEGAEGEEGEAATTAEGTESAPVVAADAEPPVAAKTEAEADAEPPAAAKTEADAEPETPAEVKTEASPAAEKKED